MITRISLRGWKSHLDSEFRFSPGVNALVGVMGSGKTSVMQAVAFALFGTFPELQSRKISLSDLIMKKPQKKNRAEVGIEFVVKGRKYAVRRRVEKGKGTTEAEIREDGRILEVNPQGVNREVERVLGMDYDLFCRAVYSEQNQIDYFLRVPKGQRMQQIDRMLQVDRFESVRERSVSASNKLVAEVSERSRILEEMKTEKPQERKASIEKEIKAMEREKTGLEKKAGALLREEESLVKRIAEFESMEQEMQEKRQEIEGMVSGIREIESTIKSVKVKTMGKGLEELRKLAEEADAGIERLEKAIESSRASIDEKRSRLASANTELKIISGDLKELRRMGAKCPLCESEISPEKKELLIKNRALQEAGLRETIEKLARGVEKEGVFLEGAQKSLRKSLVERERIFSLIEQVSSLDDLEKRREEHEKRKSLLQKDLALLEKEAGIAEIRGMREELKNRVSERSRIEAGISSLEQRMGDRSAALEEISKRMKLMERYENEISRDREIAADLKRFVAALRDTQERLRGEFLKSVNSVMNNVWGEFYPYSDFTGIRLFAENDYVLQLQDSTGWIPVDGVASGGERSMAALALRIAFSLTFVPNLRWLILDEPTHNLDGNAIQKFTSALKEGMSNFAEQVFLITHDDRISEGADSLYRLERDKNRDGPTVVSHVLQE